MPLYQNSSVTDAKIEIGNYAMYVGTAGNTAASITTNLGAGMVKSFKYEPTMYTCQAGNAPDPIQGVARETATIDIELIEYDASAFSALSNGVMASTTGGSVMTVGGQVSSINGVGLKLVNVRKLSTGSTQTTTYVVNRAFINGGWSLSPKSDNDADPISVYSFSLLCKQYATAQTIFTKTIS
jgi:hypothetical protein